MTEGGDRKDESVTFSLRELRELEEERIAREQRAAQEAAAQAARARQLAEQRAREQAERAAAEAREAARRTELEELAKREALQRAAVEQTRLEVEVRARADERERERRHEIEIARIRAVTERPGFGLAALGGAAAVGAVLAGFAAFAVHMTAVAPAHAKRVADLERSVSAEQLRAQGATGEADREQKRAADLERRASELRAEIDRKKPCPASPPTTPKGGAPGGSSHPKRVEPIGPVCQPGDPLCPTIGR